MAEDVRIPKYYRIGSRDYHDYAEAIVNMRLETLDRFDPQHHRCGEWLEHLFLAFCDQQYHDGARHYTDSFGMGLFANNMTRLMTRVVESLSFGEEWGRTVPGAWHTALTALPRSLSLEVLTCADFFCNAWLRLELRKSRLEPMLQCSMFALERGQEDDSLLQLDKLDPERRDRLFAQYPGIVIDPLLLARVCALGAGIDAQRLFAYGFTLPLKFAQTRNIDGASLETDQVALRSSYDSNDEDAELVKPSERYSKVTRCINKLYAEAAGRYFQVSLTPLHDYHNLERATERIFRDAGRSPELLHCYSNLLDIGRELYRLSWLETHGSEPIREQAKDYEDGLREVEKLVYYFHLSPSSDPKNGLDLAKAVVISRDFNAPFSQEAEAVAALLRELVGIGSLPEPLEEEQLPEAEVEEASVPPFLAAQEATVLPPLPTAKRRRVKKPEQKGFDL